MDTTKSANGHSRSNETPIPFVCGTVSPRPITMARAGELYRKLVPFLKILARDAENNLVWDPSEIKISQINNHPMEFRPNFSWFLAFYRRKKLLDIAQ